MIGVVMQKMKQSSDSAGHGNNGANTLLGVLKEKQTQGGMRMFSNGGRGGKVYREPCHDDIEKFH